MQLWNYQKGMPVAIGYGHAGVIVSCAYSPCGRFLVTGSADGAVFMWAVPEVIISNLPYTLNYYNCKLYRHIGIKVKRQAKPQQLQVLSLPNPLLHVSAATLDHRRQPNTSINWRQAVRTKTYTFANALR